MLFRLLILPVAFVFLFVLSACSDAPSEPVVVDRPEVKKPELSLKTTGVVHLDGLPPESVSAVEVLVVSELSEVARERLLRQRELFEYKITGRVEVTPGQSPIPGVSVADAVALNASLQALRAKFPPVRTDDVEMKDGRLRKFQSNWDLFEAYRHLFKSVRWDNMERGLTFISDKIDTDNRALIASSREADEAGFEEATTTLKWLKAVQQHFNAYVDLGHVYVDAQNRYRRTQATAAPAEPTDWDTFIDRYAAMLIIDTASNLVGAAFVDEDGSFEVEGHGIVIVRVELGVVSAYFLPSLEQEQRVRIENLQQL
jgi:hypothetical protein